MEWCSFAGTWLLVAGSIFQAVLELREQDALRDDVTKVLQQRPAPPATSGWWWLLPPVGYALERRRWKARQREMMAALSDDQQTELIVYINKTVGWSVVGFGGFLLATADTWNVTDSWRHRVWAFSIIMVAAATLSLAFSVLSLRRADRMRTSP